MDLENLKCLLGRTKKRTCGLRHHGALFRYVYDFPMPDHSRGEWTGDRRRHGIATICDFTLAVPEAKFGYTEVRIGFVPAIVSTFLIRRSGRKRRATCC